jgi:hypothetical protein
MNNGEHLSIKLKELAGKRKLVHSSLEHLKEQCELLRVLTTCLNVMTLSIYSNRHELHDDGLYIYSNHPHLNYSPHIFIPNEQIDRLIEFINSKLKGF